MPSKSQVHAFVTLFASGEDTMPPVSTHSAVYHDARRRLDYSERQTDSRQASQHKAHNRGRAARRQENGIFYDAADLVLPECESFMGAQLSELEQEVQAATPIHTCFRDAHTFSILLSSWSVVSAHLSDDGVHICGCSVDRRLTAAMSAVEREKKTRVWCLTFHPLYVCVLYCCDMMQE